MVFHFWKNLMLIAILKVLVYFLSLFIFASLMQLHLVGMEVNELGIIVRELVGNIFEAAFFSGVVNFRN